MCQKSYAELSPQRRILRREYSAEDIPSRITSAELSPQRRILRREYSAEDIPSRITSAELSPTKILYLSTSQNVVATIFS